jgi:hypothetical protein
MDAGRLKVDLKFEDEFIRQIIPTVDGFIG